MNLDNPDAGRLLNIDYLAAGHLDSVNADLKWFSSRFLELDDRTRCQPYQIPDAKAQAANVNGDMHWNVIDGSQVVQYGVGSRC